MFVPSGLLVVLELLLYWPVVVCVRIVLVVVVLLVVLDLLLYWPVVVGVVLVVVVLLVVLELLLYWPVVVGVGIVLVVVLVVVRGCKSAVVSVLSLCTSHTRRLMLPCAAVHFNYIDRFLWHT